jgi:RimJ/RimL family protein N-acetyltransferase
MKINKMTKEWVKEICTWQYEPPYNMYNMTYDLEIEEELLDGSYYGVLEDDILIGFFCYGKAAQVPHEEGYKEGYIDIGLGMKPSLCGQNRGKDFISFGLDFARNTFNSEAFRLTVATFNKRAIKVYQGLGFEEVYLFIRSRNNQDTEFMVMVY